MDGNKIFDIIKKTIAYLGVYVLVFMMSLGVFHPQTSEEFLALALLVLAVFWGFWGIGVLLK